MALAQFGALAKGGVNRQALCDEEIPARAQLVQWGKRSGLRPQLTRSPISFCAIPGPIPSLPPVMVGSHIDSQPTGGKFDGPLGVLAGLESVEAIIASGARPRRSIDVVSWMNEEGSRFAPGMMGSAVYSGARKVCTIFSAFATRTVSASRPNFTKSSAPSRILPRRPLGGRPAAFLEMHIEQGTIVETAGKTIGVVTGMQGKRTFRVQVDGEENHAGTSARSARRDALVSAVDIVSALQDAMWDADDIVRFTIGMFTVTPNAPSVVPGRVIFSLDLRHPDAATLRKLGDAIPEICAKARGTMRRFGERTAARSASRISDPDPRYDQIGRHSSRRAVDGYICPSPATIPAIFITSARPR